jgi:hypothetical protein
MIRPLYALPVAGLLILTAAALTGLHSPGLGLVVLLCLVAALVTTRRIRSNRPEDGRHTE